MINAMACGPYGCPMMGGGAMMTIGMGIITLLTIANLGLGIAALAKYLRSRPLQREAADKHGGTCPGHWRERFHRPRYRQPPFGH